MNLGFDLDKIFVDYPPFVPSKLIDKLYKDKSNGILHYRIPSRIEQIIRILSHYPLFRPSIPENIEIIKNIPRRKNKYFLISSRFGFLKKRTEIIVEKYQLNKLFDELFFNFDNMQPHIFKNIVIKKRKIKKYIDDDLPLLKYLAGKNPQTVFFWLNKKESHKIKTNLFAIKNLSEVIK